MTRLIEKNKKKRRSRLARSPMPVRRIAEQETPVKIKSPEECTRVCEREKKCPFG